MTKNINFEDLNKSLGSLQENITNFKKEIAKGAMDNVTPDVMRQHMNNMYDSMYRMADGLRSSIYAMQDVHDKHLKNHVPPLSAGQMEKFLKSIGGENDYEIKRPTINCANKSVKNAYVEIEYKK